MRDMKLRDMKMRHHVAGVENARHENARNAMNSMEHRVLHMSVHCRAGMHESTRKSTRFRHQLCSCERFYSAYICHLKIKSTTTGRTLRLHLKIDFDTDLASNITRHSCTISAELVVSFINI